MLKSVKQPRPSFDKAAEIGAINDAAGYCRTLWMWFLGYAGALFILASGTTHEDLLRETPIKLPLFNVENGIPLVLFYQIAPLFLLLFHLNLLLKLNDLRRRVRHVAAGVNSDDGREALRRQMKAFDYALLVGNVVVHRGERWLLVLLVNITVFVMPVALMLFVQLMFLPYHDALTTWLHRAYIATDLAFIIFVQLWLGLSEVQRVRFFSRFTFDHLKIIPAAPVIAASFFVLAYPGEIQAIWPHPRAGDDTSEYFGIRRSLYLPGGVFWSKDPPPEILAVFERNRLDAKRDGKSSADINNLDNRLDAQRRYGEPLNLTGRHLEYANFGGTSLINVKLSNAYLQGAYLEGAQLEGAELFDAELQATILNFANLQTADLSSAKMQGSFLRKAQLQGADLRVANLQGAILIEAKLQGADLRAAKLQGAIFTSASIYGSDFSGSADISYAELSHLDRSTYDFEDLRSAVALQVPELQRRSDFLERITAAESRARNGDPPFGLARGQNIWTDEPTLFGTARRKLSFVNSNEPATYLAVWTNFIAKLACSGGDINADQVTANRAIASQIVLPFYLSAPFDGNIRRGPMLARAILDNPCARAHLSQRQIDELEEYQKNNALDAVLPAGATVPQVPNR
jgi:Pentapeptide repeats (8 copies)